MLLAATMIGLVSGSGLDLSDLQQPLLAALLHTTVAHKCNRWIADPFIVPAGNKLAYEAVDCQHVIAITQPFVGHRAPC